MLRLSALDYDHVPSLRLLATIHSAGHGLPQSDLEAARLWSAGARLNDAHSQCEIGKCYEKGRGVKENDKQAAAWYQKAAAQKFSRGLYLLGRLTEEGRGGIQRSDIISSQLFERAAQSDIYARQRLHQILNCGIHYFLDWRDMANTASDIILKSNESISSAQQILETLKRHQNGSEDYNDIVPEVVHIYTTNTYTLETVQETCATNEAITSEMNKRRKKSLRKMREIAAPFVAQHIARQVQRQKKVVHRLPDNINSGLQGEEVLKQPDAKHASWILSLKKVSSEADSRISE